jgi:hypothetical protein
MTRILFAAVALSIFPLIAAAGETVVHLNVRPMPAPKPALKYQLLPEVHELNPGNASHFYLRCFAEQRNFFFSKEANGDRARYLAMPLAVLPVDKLRRYGGFALEQADWAARLSSCDWQLVQHVQTNGMDGMVPELGRLQILGAALQVRLRVEVAGRRFDDAIRTAKTMFAFARHLGEYPREAGNRVGLSVAELALSTLEEMVQQPGCPNLYWALTDLPCPLVDLRKGFQGDSTLIAAELRPLRDDAPMTEEELNKFVTELAASLGLARAQAGQPLPNLRSTLVAEAKDTEKLRAARTHLIELGSAGDMAWRAFQVWRFLPLQLVLLDEKRDYEIQRDESMKLLGLEPWQIDALAGSEQSPCCENGLFTEFLPQVIEARRAQGRLEQRIALLRHLEALRLYAADHGGKLPDKLADLSVPLPADPFTGKPFVYKVEACEKGDCPSLLKGTVPYFAQTAHLCGSPPRGEEQNPCFNVHYEVTIQK